MKNNLLLKFEIYNLNADQNYFSTKNFNSKLNNISGVSAIHKMRKTIDIIFLS